MGQQMKPISPDGEYEVTRVGEETRDWQTKGDNPREMRSYRISVKLGDKEFKSVELGQLKTTAAPTVGQKLNGKVMEREYEYGGQTKTDLKFEKARGGGGRGGGRAYKPRPEDAPTVYVAKQAQIVAQHSQNMALRVLELASSRIAASPDPSGDLHGEAVNIMGELGIPMTASVGGEDTDLGLVQAFTADANRAGKRAAEIETENRTITDALKAIS